MIQTQTLDLSDPAVMAGAKRTLRTLHNAYNAVEAAHKKLLRYSELMVGPEEASSHMLLALGSCHNEMSRLLQVTMSVESDIERAEKSLARITARGVGGNGTEKPKRRRGRPPKNPDAAAAQESGAS